MTEARGTGDEYKRTRREKAMVRAAAEGSEPAAVTQHEPDVFEGAVEDALDDMQLNLALAGESKARPGM